MKQANIAAIDNVVQFPAKGTMHSFIKQKLVLNSLYVEAGKRFDKFFAEAQKTGCPGAAIMVDFYLDLMNIFGNELDAMGGPL